MEDDSDGSFFRFKAELKVNHFKVPVIVGGVIYHANTRPFLTSSAWDVFSRLSGEDKKALCCFLAAFCFVLTAAIFQDNEYQPGIAAIGSFQTNPSVSASAVKNSGWGKSLAAHTHDAWSDQL